MLVHSRYALTENVQRAATMADVRTTGLLAGVVAITCADGSLRSVQSSCASEKTTTAAHEPFARGRRAQSASGERAVFGDDHEANRKREPGLRGLPASCFQPGGVIVWVGDNQHLVGGELP